MINSPLIENNMFDTLTFSKKMQNAGMTQNLAEQLAYSLLNFQNNQFENLLTKNEFKKFEKEVRRDIEDVKSDIEEVKNDIEEVKNDIEEVKNDIEEVKNDIEEVKNDIEEVRWDIEEFRAEIKSIRFDFKNDVENLVSKKEFNLKMKNLELNITIKMGLIMASGIGILALLIKI
jgi:septal ring factor EnvC (AmiA/AmiB activator)